MPKPLAKVRILVGRARHQASALSAGLKEQGAQVLSIPFIEIRRPTSYTRLDTALKNLRSYDWLILTSVNGVEALHQRLKKLHLRKTNLKHLRIAAIGPATRKAIQSHGLKVHVMPKEYVAESVVKSLKSKVKGKKILLARAKVARDVIPQQLRKSGAKVDVVEAYETIVPQPSRRRLKGALKDPKRRPHIITFTSSSSVKNFLALLGSRRNFNGIKMASIGPITSATLLENALNPDIQASEYTIPGLIAAICKCSAHISH
jgi:uroporphyrinogen-III synthase